MFKELTYENMKILNTILLQCFPYSTCGLRPFKESPVIQHFERGIAIKTCDVITFNTYTRLPHILCPSFHSYLSFPYSRETGFNDAERTKNAPDLSNPYTSDWLLFYCTFDMDITISMYPVKVKFVQQH